MDLNLPLELKTFLLAMTPLGELRISLPVALAVYKLPFWSAYLWSVLGNVVPVFFILWGLEFVSNFLSRRFSCFSRFFQWLFSWTKNQHGEVFNRAKWTDWLLVVFVAIPLPFTGAWTGSLISFVFNLSPKKSFLLISLGVLLAGLIVGLASLSGIFLEKYFSWQVILGALLIATIIYSFFKWSKKNNSQL